MHPDSYSLIASLNALRKYGVPRSSAVFILNNFWQIKDRDKDIISTYYMLHWTTPYFKQALCNGLIEREGIMYQVIYYRTTPADISKADRGVLVSFRALQDEYAVHPVALVTLAS
jgi:hypothetical protein